ncbi:MAG TPA: pitrilysin family protein, partial [Polyangia bacterium]|nr:pitrilysin family protein [Polyangia bacterium]
GALIAALLARGTRTRSARQIEDEARALGGRLTGFSDRDHLGLRAELVPSGWARGAALLADCLLRPSFPADEVDDSRRVVVDRGRRAPGDAAKAERLFDQALWPGHPFRLEPAGTAATLAALGRIRLLDHYRRHYPLSRLVISVVGDVDPKEVVATLSGLFAGAPAGMAPPETPAVPVHTEPVALFETTTADAARLVLGYPGPDPRDPDRPALEVLAEILSSGGRLDRLFAGATPLAFRAGARAATGVAPGYLAVEIGCRPDDVDAVVAALRAILAEVAADGVTVTETERAARRLAGRRALELRGEASIADALALDEAYGLGLMSYRDVPAALARVTAADVLRAARRFLDPKRETIAVVRPEPPSTVARALKGAR